MNILVDKVVSKVKRETLQLPIVSYIAQQSYSQKKNQYQTKIPRLNIEDQKIIDILYREGAYRTNLQQLSIPKSIEAVNTAVNLLSNSPEFYSDENQQGIPGHVLRAYPAIILWGLNDRLLDIAENYLRLPIYYLGAEVRREFPNGKCAGVRKWHLDTEDYSMLKIIVYLTDVDRTSGPFEYISRPETERVTKELKYKSGLISDELMDKHIPQQDWVACTGSKMDAVFVDTSNVLHRAKPCLTKERLSITYHYISQYPIHLRSKNLSISRSHTSLLPYLTERQIQCLFPI